VSVLDRPFALRSQVGAPGDNRRLITRPKNLERRVGRSGNGRWDRRRWTTSRCHPQAGSRLRRAPQTPRAALRARWHARRQHATCCTRPIPQSAARLREVDRVAERRHEETLAAHDPSAGASDTLARACTRQRLRRTHHGGGRHGRNVAAQPAQRSRTRQRKTAGTTRA